MGRAKSGVATLTGSSDKRCCGRCLCPTRFSHNFHRNAPRAARRRAWCVRKPLTRRLHRGQRGAQFQSAQGALSTGPRVWEAERVDATPARR
jgi:hypothetical protein